MFSIRQLIAQYQPNTYAETASSSAVLLILITDNGIDHEILLLQRPANLSSYAGDMCFPGGLKEVTDHDLQYTALRETFEEIGLVIDKKTIIGQLDDFKDKKNCLVRPYVARIERSQLATMSLSKDEVARVVFISLTAINHSRLDSDNRQPANRKPSYLIACDDVLIWGLTASILVHLSNILRGTDKPIGRCCF